MPWSARPLSGREACAARSSESGKMFGGLAFFSLSYCLSGRLGASCLSPLSQAEAPALRQLERSCEYPRSAPAKLGKARREASQGEQRLAPSTLPSHGCCCCCPHQPPGLLLPNPPPDPPALLSHRQARFLVTVPPCVVKIACSWKDFQNEISVPLCSLLNDYNCGSSTC